MRALRMSRTFPRRTRTFVWFAEAERPPVFRRGWQLGAGNLGLSTWDFGDRHFHTPKLTPAMQATAVRRVALPDIPAISVASEVTRAGESPDSKRASNSRTGLSLARSRARHRACCLPVVRLATCSERITLALILNHSQPRSRRTSEQPDRKARECRSRPTARPASRSWKS